MLAQLSPEQIELMSEVRYDWLSAAILRPRPCHSGIREGVKFLYSLAGFEEPAILILDNPAAVEILTSQVRDQVWDQVGAQVRDQVWDQVRDQVRDQVWDQVGDQVGAQVWAQVGDQVRDQVWAQVWAQVGDQVGAQVGDQVRDQVWAQVWAQVGSQVGSQVRDQVGDQVRFFWAKTGLGWDSGWVAYYDFFDRSGLLVPDIFRRYKAALEAGLWDFMATKALAIVCTPPRSIHLDRPEAPWGQRRLHRLDGPAVEWGDGHGNYAVAGVVVDGDLIEDPSKITRDKILGEDNLEVRKALIQIVGLPAFMEMTDSRTLDEDQDRSGMPRRLLSLDAGSGRRWCVVEVECPSKRDKHYLWVPPEMERCSQAVAWTFGMEAEDYRPLVEA